jgi:dipeptidyl aminopeptidase/acylaminoacyl peptidase
MKFFSNGEKKKKWKGKSPPTRSHKFMTTKTLPIPQKTRQLTSHDLAKIKIIEDCKISPDGEKIVFVEKVLNLEKNEYNSKIYSLPFSGGTPRDFTQGPHDSSPVFSPDGKLLAFLRKVGDFLQIFVIPVDGGEARQLTCIKNSPSEMCWSPDGTQIAFSAFVTEKGLVSEDEKPEEDPYKKYNQDVKVINRIWYKLDGKGFLHDKRSQIFLVDVASGNTKQITFGDHDAFSPRFSPDGKWIVFSSNRNPESDYEPYSYIYIVSKEGGEPLNLTPGEFFAVCPNFSPNGEVIAFVGTEDAKNFYASPRLWIVPTQGGKPECLTRIPDRPVTDQSINDLRAFDHGGELPIWDAKGEKLYISRSDAGKVYLIGVDVKTKKTKEYVVGNHVVHKWDIAPKAEKGAVVIGDPTNPNDIWSLDLSNGETKRLTQINHDFLREVSLSTPEFISTHSKDGTRVEGWILKPPNFQEGEKYPAIIEIHGGPMAMYAWSFFFEFQLLANHGFVVAYSNPRGSMGYEEAFCEAIKGDWGNLDYQDVMAFTDEVSKKSYVDETRLGVAGGSYGGFMTNWIIGHTQRFKAAVTMRSVTNEASMCGTSDYGHLWEYHHGGGNPWSNPEHYRKISPIAYVANMKTPLLILHSEEDLRCPIEQAEQLFVFLKKLKQEVLFIRFPGESHDLSRTGKPWHRIFRLDQIVKWFEHHL